MRYLEFTSRSPELGSHARRRLGGDPATKPCVKTSLAPGSKVITQYPKDTGLIGLGVR